MPKRLKGKPARVTGSPSHATSIAGPTDNASKQAVQPSSRWPVVVICFLLALVVWVVFGQTLQHEFVNYDDGRLVYENSTIAQGLSLNGVVLAFTHINADEWYPLTTLSHMLDCQLYGLNPGGHHLTNVLLHAATAICLFLVLRNLTGTLWPSAFVAAVFAIHPLRVESVAWVSERKDVLSGLFFVLTVGTYIRYVRRPFALSRYSLVLVLFTLGLLSKTMLVTLPFVLLLLDYWPLARLRLGSETATEPSQLLDHPRQTFPTFRRLIIEKVPFLLLATAACVATILAQQDAIQSVKHVDFPSRIGNALVSYTAYIWQIIFPVGLAVFYPHPGNRLSGWAVVTSGLMLLIVSAGVIAGRRKRPYLLVGWLWYLGMLVPVIGLMQVGDQARADRYTYLPQIGLYILLTWGAVDLGGYWRHRRAVLRAAAITILAGLMVAAHAQTRYWRNSVSLWSHALVCTSQNYIAHNNLGVALAAQGKWNEASEHYELALQLKPNYAEVHNNLGIRLTGQGKLKEAIQHFEQALQLKPDNAEAHNNLGAALAAQGKLNEAVQHCQLAVQLKPDFAEAQNNLGYWLALQGKWNQALQHCQLAVQLKPDFAEAQNGLGVALAQQEKLNEAIQHYQRALQLKPDYAEALYNFGNALAAQGKMNEAIQHYERGLQLKSDHANAHNNLGAALAAQGRFNEAIQHFQQALNLATTQTNAGLAERIRTRLKSYQSASPQSQTP